MMRKMLSSNLSVGMCISDFMGMDCKIPKITGLTKTSVCLLK